MHSFLAGFGKRCRAEIHEFSTFANFLFFYSKKRTLSTSYWFERKKNRLVKLFLTKRGRYNRLFLHVSTVMVLVVGVLITPYLQETFPLFASAQANQLNANASAQQQSINVGDTVFNTQIAQKPRDSIITYTVQKGDTLSSIAKTFGISEDTIRWANDLTSDSLSVGDQLKILPVTGVAYKVQSGDTIYSIAKKYKTDPQGIVDFPFNTFADPETFTLVVGEILYVPNGKIVATPEASGGPSGASTYSGPIPVASGGWFFPLPGGKISQYASWYHMALDITSPIGTPIYAAHSGTVSYVSVGTWDWGFGNNVWIDDGDGYMTHYAHMSVVPVHVGEQMVGGQSIVGYVGVTGHTTGPHCHFEIKRNGVLVDPIPYIGGGGGPL